MVIVKAKIEFGFQAGPLYKGWDLPRRMIVKDNVKADIDAKTQNADQLKDWVNPGVDLTVDEFGSTPEAAVRSLLATELETTEGNADFTAVIGLQGGTSATPESIIYVWRDGKRYCEHAYLLTVEAKPAPSSEEDWEVDDSDEKPKMFARVVWPI